MTKKLKITVLISVVVFVILAVVIIFSNGSDFKGSWIYSECYVDGALTDRPYGFEFGRYYTKGISFDNDGSLSISCKHGYMYIDKMRYANAYDLSGEYTIIGKEKITILCDGYDEKTFLYEIKEGKLHLTDGNFLYVFEKEDKNKGLGFSKLFSSLMS